jgi:hypothetical protein
MRPNFYSLVDLFAPLYLLLFYFLAERIVAKNKNNLLYKKYFIGGFWYKMFGSFCFYLIYAFYYRGGDSCTYFINGTVFNEYMLFENFGDGLRVIFSNFSGYENFPSWVYYKSAYVYGEGYILIDSRALLTARISSVVSIFCLNSYLCTNLAFGFLSYIAIFKLFTLFCRLYPEWSQGLSFAFLKVPSVIFWGSSVNKDTICLAMLCILIYTFYKVFIQLQFSLKYLLVLPLCAYVIFSIKSYILVAAIPGLIVFVLINYQNRMLSGAARYLFTPFLVAISVVSLLLLYQTLSDTFSEFSADNLAKKAEGFQSWHTQLQDESGGSGYSLGEMDFSAGSILRTSPLALAIALFGPFPWQVRNAVMFLSSLEGMYFFYLFLVAFSSSYGLSKIGKIGVEPVLLFCLLFTVILGISVGLTSFNYGALVRFKIPLMPFFASFLVLLRQPLKKTQK